MVWIFGMVSGRKIPRLHCGAKYRRLFFLGQKLQRYSIFILVSVLIIISDASKQGHKYDYKEDWGEAFIGLANPTIYILDIENENIIQVKLTHNKLAVGQVIWSPDGKELVFVGWPYNHRKLGLKYCYNREYVPPSNY